MLELIGFALVKELIVFLFGQQLQKLESYNIEGAPGWYAKSPPKDSIAVYVYVDGSGPAWVEPVKARAREEMETVITEAMDKVIYDKYRNLEDPKEKALIAQFRQDPELAAFIKANLRIKKLESFNARESGFLKNARPARTFAMGVLQLRRPSVANADGSGAQVSLEQYQTERVRKIARALTEHRANTGFEELERTVKAPSTGQPSAPPTTRAGKAFEELEAK